MITIERLSDILVVVADTLVADFDLIDFLHLVAVHAGEVSEGAVVGLVLADEHGRLHYVGASHESARALELIQIQELEGPCLDCFTTGEAVVNLDLAEAGERWPTFAPAAAQHGIRSVHAFPMRLRERVLGALNVFGTESASLAPAEARVIQALADVASIGLVQEQAIARAELVNEQLQAALNSRIVIEQAKGAVARSMGVSIDEAFDLIRERARHDRAPLTAFAHELVTSPDAIARLKLES
jgi:GAF domain-containing protein